MALPPWLETQTYPDVNSLVSAFIDSTIERLSLILASFHSAAKAMIDADVAAQAVKAAAAASAAPGAAAAAGAMDEASSPEPPTRAAITWGGLDAESRAAFAELAREQVDGLSSDLSRARAVLLGVAIADVRDSDFSEGMHAAQGELARLGKLIGALPPVPGAPVYAPPARPLPSAAPPPAPPQSPMSAFLAATPLSTAMLALEAYRECLVRVVDFLEAAAEGRSSLPSADILGALEAMCASVYTAEARLKESLQACGERCRRGREEVLPLAKGLAAARAEARARAVSLNSRVTDLEAALGSARHALATLQTAAARPLALGSVLAMSKTLAPPSPLPPLPGGTPPSAAGLSALQAQLAPSAQQIAFSLTARLQNMHAGRGGEETTVFLGDTEVAIGSIPLATTASSPLAPTPQQHSMSEINEEEARGQSASGSSSSSSSSSSSLSSSSAKPSLQSLIQGLTAAQKAKVVAGLPKNWTLSDMQALVSMAKQGE